MLEQGEYFEKHQGITLEQLVNQMSLIQINYDNAAEYLPKILDIEAHARYPFGDDSFMIDHGTDYFEFFNRMGSYQYYAWIEDGQVSAVICLVLRQVPLSDQGEMNSAWYLCDLKVHPKYRGKNIVSKMMRQIVRLNYFRCHRGYAVSMDHPEVSENRMARLFRYFRLIPTHTTQLALWSLDEQAMAHAQPIIEQHRGLVRYLSMQNIKDIVLTSTQAPMPILHAQFGPMADSASSGERDSAAIHMFCSPNSDQLTQDLQTTGLIPSSSATILAHRMPTSDWKWMLTSEI